MQLRFRHIARNVFSNWFATGANMAVGFFLAPFIVHHLGNAAYGVWVLAISSVNYLGLLDLGMRSSVLRFVSKGHAVGDHAGASDALSAALWVRLQISGLVLLIAGTLAYLFPRLFHVPAELAHQAQIAVMIIGLTTGLSMSLGVFGGVLSGLNRYDLQSIATLVQLVMRASGVVWLLLHGYGIVAVAICEFVATLAYSLLTMMIARRIYPQLTISLAKPKPGVLRSLWSYSFYAFLTTIAIQLVYQTDNLVVGTFVSTTAVTFYSIGNSLCRYTDQFTGSMTLTFVPAASSYESAGDSAKLKELYRMGTRALMTICLPILVSLIFRGRNFIGLWMGPQYMKESGTVLIILACALLFSQTNNPAGAIAFGVSKHKTTARWAIGEGIANLTLSVILVHWMGLYGVALGTLIPSLVVNVGLWPRFIAKLIGISVGEILFEIWGPMFVAAVPFAVGSYLVNAYAPAHNLVTFFVETLLLLPLFLVGVAVVFRDQVREFVLPKIRSFFQPSAA